MKIRTVLDRVYRLLEDKKKWTKGTLARNDKSRACDVDDPDACKFCLIGAVEYVCLNDTVNAASTYDFLDDFAVEKYQKSSITFNDSRKTTYTDLMTFLRSAIGRAKRKGL